MKALGKSSGVLKTCNCFVNKQVGFFFFWINGIPEVWKMHLHYVAKFERSGDSRSLSGRNWGMRQKNLLGCSRHAGALPQLIACTAPPS